MLATAQGRAVTDMPANFSEFPSTT